MFNIGMLELVVILLIAFLVVGPKDLPKVARWLARLVKKARSYIDQFKEDMGLDELEEDVKQAKAEVDGVAQDVDVTDDLRAAQDEMRAIAEGVDVELRRTEKEVRQAMDKE